jgi:DNA-binding HxlR family transcriptional regulator
MDMASGVKKDKGSKAPASRGGPTKHGLPALTERKCSVARTVSILSDAWTFLVIREGFFSARRFEEFRSALDIPRGTLTDRLRRLTREEIFREVSYSDTSSRVEYRLTKPGIDLYPTFIALMQFGDRWLADPDGPPLKLIHESCGCVSKPFVACSCCKQRVSARRVIYRDGSGAGKTPVEPTRRSRRTADEFMRGRPSSVSRSLEVIGDRWSFLVIREAFFGARRFDKLQLELNIATNILTDRLNRLVERGIFKRRKYQSLPERFEYLLTPMGMDLYGPLIMMMVWGDRWRANGKPPLLLKHLDCGKDFTPVVICNKCGEPIQAHSMKYKMRYDADKFGGPKSGRALPDRS